MRLYNSKNEILVFLCNVFLLQIVGKGALLLILWIFRFFGMPQPYFYYYSIPNHGRIVFLVLLVIAVVISVVRILRRGKKQ